MSVLVIVKNGNSIIPSEGNDTCGLEISSISGAVVLKRLAPMGPNIKPVTKRANSRIITGIRIFNEQPNRIGYSLVSFVSFNAFFCFL
jgi:hypothetical protein